MNNAIAAIAAALVIAVNAVAMQPSTQVLSSDSGHIGLGSMRCQIVISGFDFSDNRDTRQWIFGYLAGIDAGVFSLKGERLDQRRSSEDKLVRDIGAFIADYCNSNPTHSVGDAMLGLHKAYNLNACDVCFEKDRNDEERGVQ